MFLLSDEYILSIINGVIYVFIKGEVYFIDNQWCNLLRDEYILSIINDVIYVFIKGWVYFIDNQWCNLCFY